MRPWPAQRISDDPQMVEGTVVSMRRSRQWVPSLLSVACLMLLAGCDRLDMYDQPRYDPLEASSFFKDGLSARPTIEGTIPRGGLREDQPFYTGQDKKKPVAEIPAAAFRALYDRHPDWFEKPFEEIEPAELRQRLMERGRERFEISCSVCHGQTGEGDGMIVRRGFRRPPSFHSDRLREAANGYLFDVITHGFGAMSSYASRIEVADRWAIVAYLRALQFSQNARLEDVPEDRLRELTERRHAQSKATDQQEDAR